MRSVEFCWVGDMREQVVVERRRTSKLGSDWREMEGI